MKTETVEKQSLELVKVSQKYLEVKTEDEAKLASEFVNTKLKPMEKEIKEAFDPIVADALKAHRTACAKRSQYLDPVTKAISMIRNAVGKFANAEAERRRKEREKEEAKVLAKQERLQERAEAARAEGKEEKAEQLELKAQSQVVIPKEADKPKVQGTSMKSVWDVGVTDKVELIKAVSEGKVPDTVLDINLSALRKYVSATEGKMPIPGIVFRKTLVPSFR